ncbi:hypothetical protein MJO28_014430 [Puccinia striiformis f. sp. tritici]|uniref:Uncharacterized protein n=1 Tax=Puccinia striiformis f. sp. tritici TaxID=168172 RepID=A0ACC0DU60_9BASI|nr:hypothetical protein Pst134EB_027445 [Puccinia striiformis f. sp. tritici]KAI7938851.1 hypothetical protein MJO28_014430 [Puccinia striiformis f. sp. tritici]KAI7939560.1 hypothetical protein MJO29_014296 [Puccinia striiformis f. sp. tritici]KAI9616637.1 hypothetical protein H4Q26_011037 [Puccinia striiformis f. sp. tritici PST-130]
MRDISVSSADTNLKILKPMFFYGTLMNEHILARVIDRPTDGLDIQRAQLTGHCRLKIRGAHYPGLIPASVAEVALGRPATLGEQTVTGTLVSGLTSSDVALLDAFEGEEYEVQTALVNTIDCNSPPVEAVVYLYAPAIVSRNVLPCVWSYDEFLKNHATQWVVDPSMYR